MKCPQCGAWSMIKDTRKTRRRRECANGHRFTTEEHVRPDSISHGPAKVGRPPKSK